eukprot:277062-Chlamydomonas_euryale.AAC.2
MGCPRTPPQPQPLVTTAASQHCMHLTELPPPRLLPRRGQPQQPQQLWQRWMRRLCLLLQALAVAAAGLSLLAPCQAGDLPAPLETPTAGVVKPGEERAGTLRATGGGHEASGAWDALEAGRRGSRAVAAAAAAAAAARAGRHACPDACVANGGVCNPELGRC